MDVMVSVANVRRQVVGDDYSCHSGHNQRVGLRERIELIMQLRNVSQRELARRSKLKDERHLGVILSRLRKNPNADIERETLAALAEGGEVSMVWLATGDGLPDDQTGASAEIHVERDPELVHRTARDPLEAAINVAFAPDRHTPTDVLRVVEAWRAFPRKDALDGDLIETARAWLDAARALRIVGRDADPWSLLERATLGRNGRTSVSAPPLPELRTNPRGAPTSDQPGPTSARDLVFGQIAKNMAREERLDRQRAEAGFEEGEPTTRVGAGAKDRPTRKGG